MQNLGRKSITESAVRGFGFHRFFKKPKTYGFLKNLSIGFKPVLLGLINQSRVLGCVFPTVVLSRVISPLVGLIAIATLLITPLTATHEPPSRGSRWALQ